MTRAQMLAHLRAARALNPREAVLVDVEPGDTTAARYAIAFLAVFTAPFVEEFIYRGVLFAALQRLTGAIFAGITTLALFTLIHVPQYWPNIGVLAAVGADAVREVDHDAALDEPGERLDAALRRAHAALDR